MILTWNLYVDIIISFCGKRKYSMLLLRFSVESTFLATWAKRYTSGSQSGGRDLKGYREPHNVVYIYQFIKISLEFKYFIDLVSQEKKDIFRYHHFIVYITFRLKKREPFYWKNLQGKNIEKELNPMFFDNDVSLTKLDMWRNLIISR